MYARHLCYAQMHLVRSFIIKQKLSREPETAVIWQEPPTCCIVVYYMNYIVAHGYPTLLQEVLFYAIKHRLSRFNINASGKDLLTYGTMRCQHTGIVPKLAQKLLQYYQIFYI